MRIRAWTGLVLVAVLAACAAADDADSSDSNVTSGIVKKPLEKADEDGLYHWTEGSEFLPYFAVRALNILERDASGNFTGVETNVPILSDANLARYGFIADKRDDSRRVPDKILNDKMPDGAKSLPIGMTLARAPDTGLVSIGVNCASCHVGMLKIDGKENIINGVPNMLEVGRFFAEVIQTLKFIAKDGGGILKTKFVARVTAQAIRTKLEFRSVKDEILDTKDSFGDQLDMLWKLVGEKEEFDKLVEAMDATPERKGLLRARKTFFDGLAARIDLSKENTAQGFGRTDAFGTAKNMIFFGHGYKQATHAPMSFPSMLNMETFDLFHANANTNSVIQRNIGQSIGLGAVFADVDSGGSKKTIASSNLTNLLKLEHAIYKIAPPAWPAKRDEAAAERGKEVYKRECRGCHEPKPLDNGLYQSKVVPQSKVGTDPEQLRGLAEHIVPSDGPEAGKDLGHLFSLTGPVFKGVEDSYRQMHKGVLEKEEQAYIASSPEAAKIAKAREKAWWRTSAGPADDNYVARPLDGIWATAPFLHNASVPTLMDMLTPAKDRPKTFCVGHRDYDTTKVGYTVITPKDGQCPSGDTLFDTDDTKPELRGNSNKGHEFGVTMPDSDKKDLIELLKGFGAGQPRPTVLED